MIGTAVAARRVALARYDTLDGHLVAYGISPGDSENSVIHILDTATGKALPDSIDRSSATEHHWNYAPVIHGVSERDVMGELRNNAGEFLSFVRGLTRGGAMKFG